MSNITSQTLIAPASWQVYGCDQLAPTHSNSSQPALETQHKAVVDLCSIFLYLVQLFHIQLQTESMPLGGQGVESPKQESDVLFP